MPLVKYYPLDNRSKSYFFDDFIGSAYDNRVWAVTGSGSLSYVAPCIGGQLKIISNSNSSYELYQNNITNYSAAWNGEVSFRLDIPARTNLSSYKMGLEGDGTYKSSDWAAFYLAATGNWQAQTSKDGSLTQTDTGIAYDSDWHIFKILLTETNALFYIDRALVVTSTTNITVRNLQAYVYSLSNSSGALDSYLDFCQIVGGRNYYDDPPA